LSHRGLGTPEHDHCGIPLCSGPRYTVLEHGLQNDIDVDIPAYFNTCCDEENLRYATVMPAVDIAHPDAYLAISHKNFRDFL
jgi:hypothetical protein